MTKAPFYGFWTIPVDGKDFDLRITTRDDVRLWLLRCPGCGEWGELDDDQLNGRVSVQHECGFHETHDFAERLKAVGAMSDEHKGTVTE